MIAIKLILQTLSVFAVGGSVVGGAVYKISNDINSKTLKNSLSTKIEEQKILSVDFDKNALALAEVIKEIATENQKLEAIEAQLLTLQNTEKDMKSKITKLESEISIITNAIHNTEAFVFNALRETTKTEKLLQKVKDSVTAQNALLALAEAKVKEEVNAVAIAQTAKDSADDAKKQAKEKEETDATAVVNLKATLITEKISYTEAQRLHNEENSKAELPTCNTDSTESEGEEGSLEAKTCPSKKTEYKDDAQLITLKAAEDAAKKIVDGTEASIATAENAANTSKAAYTTSEAKATEANTTLTNANNKKTAEDEKVKEINRLLVLKKQFETKSLSNLEEAKKEDEKAYIAWNKEQEYQGNKEKEKRVNEEKLSQCMTSIIETEPSIQVFKDAITKLQSKKDRFTNIIARQKQEITQLTQDIESLTSKTSEN